MIARSRTTRNLFFAYVLLAALIVGGVGWASIATLRLERERLANDQIDTALRIINRQLAPYVFSEARRPYSDYSACRVPEHVYIPGGDSRDTPLLEASPLYFGPPEPWMKLHFQVSPTGQWQSPQVSEDTLCLSAFPVHSEAVLQERRAQLKELESTCVSYESLAAGVSNARRRDRELLCVCDDCDDATGKGVSRASRFGRKALKECLDRGGDLIELQKRLLPDESCDPPSVLVRNLGDTWRDESDSGPLAVNATEMSAVWLDCIAHADHPLAFIRAIDVQGVRYFQGFLVDWDMLKHELLASVREFLPDADLVPVRDNSPPDRTRPVVMPNVRLVTGAQTAALLPWSSTHLMLAIAWCATAVIIVGTYLAVRSVVVLAERKTQFAYAVTHELRTPLTTLRLYTDMLASGLVKQRDQEGYFKTLADESERLAGIVSAVLDYARIENDKVKLDVKSLTVADLLDAIREHCDTRCQNAGKVLSIDVNGLSSDPVTTDPQLVRQVVTNLVDNACKHSRDATDASVVIRAHAAGDRIAIDVEDRGPGITPADRSLLFKPFRRGKASRQQATGGIGLGLSLAKSWSRILKGDLECVADPTRPGACFRLTIPRRIQ